MITVRVLGQSGDLQRLMEEIRQVDVDLTGSRIMAPKGVWYLLKITDVRAPAANILKQEALAAGADAAVGKGVCNCSVKESDVILMGTLAQIKQILKVLAIQPFGLKEVGERIRQALEQCSLPPPPIAWGSWSLSFQLPLIMGIINVTPDSFSGDGLAGHGQEEAVRRANQLVEAGASIIDIGGESTRPGASPVSEEEELKRVIPVIERIAGIVPVPVCVDTYKAGVAREALRAGAAMVNDVWGLQGDPAMIEVIASHQAPLVLMHNKKEPAYEDLIQEVYEFLFSALLQAKEGGVDPGKVILDPGIGFGKTPEQNLVLLRHLAEFTSLGRPLLVGVSRKSVIGHVLGTPVLERLEGSLASACWAVLQGARIVRVHDVRETALALKMIMALQAGQRVDPGDPSTGGGAGSLARSEGQEIRPPGVPGERR